jgi:hypothetical protein
MEASSIIVRPMQADDAPAAMKLSAAEGWNQTANDWKFLIAYPGSICIAAGE